MRFLHEKSYGLRNAAIIEKRGKSVKSPLK